MRGGSSSLIRMASIFFKAVHVITEPMAYLTARAAFSTCFEIIDSSLPDTTHWSFNIRSAGMIHHHRRRIGWFQSNLDLLDVRYAICER